MSVVAHVPGHTWAAAHRVLTLVLSVLLVAAVVGLTVVLLTRDTGGASPSAPDLPRYDDTCAGAPVGAAC